MKILGGNWGRNGTFQLIFLLISKNHPPPAGLGLEENHYLRLRLELKLVKVGCCIHQQNLSPCNGGDCSCPLHSLQNVFLGSNPFLGGKEGSAIIHCYDQSIVHLPNHPRCIRSLLVHPFFFTVSFAIELCPMIFARLFVGDVG